MWRSFFLASGVFSILMGFQTLAVDQFKVANFRRIPKMMATKALDYMGSDRPQMIAQNQEFQQFPQMGGVAAPNAQVPRSRSVVGQQPAQSRSAYGPSAYGPTRYQGTQSSSFNRFGGNRGRQAQMAPQQMAPQRAPFQQQPSSAGQFGLAGYQNPVAPSNSPNMMPQQGSRQFLSARTVAPRIVKTKDWMPWSLMAAGVLIVLYTSSGRHHHGE